MTLSATVPAIAVASKLQVPPILTQVRETVPRASVIIVNYNGRPHLEKCLPALVKADFLREHEIIVVDNASTDGSADYVEQNFPQVRVIRTGINWGFGQGNNVGVRWARGKYLAFLNPDTTVEPGWLEALIAALEANPQAGLATSKILLLADPGHINTCGNDVHYTGLTLCRGMEMDASAFPDQSEVVAVSGAAFAIRREVFEALGGFDETFFLYMEDTDLSWRARLAGYRCIYAPKSVVHHDYRLRFGLLKTFYQERNRYLMLLKSLQWRTLLVLLPALLLAEAVTWGFVLLRDRRRLVNKLRAYVWVMQHWDDVMASRRRVQAGRRISDRELIAHCTHRLDFKQTGDGFFARLAHVVFNPVFFVLHRLALALIGSQKEAMNETTVITTGEKKLIARVATMTRQPLFANAGYLLGINAVGSLVGFVFWGVAARLYRPEHVGTASAVLSAVALVSGFARLGMDHGLVRLLPESKYPHRILNTAFTSNTVVALLVGAVFVVGLPLWSPALVILQQNGWYAATFLIYVVVATLGTVVQMAFVARRQAVYALLHTCVINGARLILIILFAGLGASGLVVSVALAFSLALAVSLRGFLPCVEPGYRPRIEVSWHDLATLVPYSLGNHVAGLLAQIPQIVLPLLILELVGPASSGHAYVALMIGGLLTSPGLALASSAFAESTNAPQRSPSILTRAAASGLALTVSAGVIVGVAAPWLLRLFGPTYAQEASGLLRWLALTAPPTVLSGLYFTHLRVKKQIGRLILLNAIAAAATLSVVVALMPRIGIAASGLGLLVGNGLVAARALYRWVKRDKAVERLIDTSPISGIGPRR